ncbi:RNA polymerase sigma factor [Enterocloster bolteae]|uniref:RNA polymerase sigma factor n=1 Tax=Enterocloster bolteae TaxID=208479 RepID=UPI0025A0AB35|nr:sigma-70 family RNA polymerase sigma factor [Enterocloster bolteae]
MDSMEEIYMKHGKMIYGFLLTRTRDPGLAEELTQETFYQAVKHIGGYKGESSISTWLCAIAKNLCRDYLRRQKDHVPLDEAEQVSVESAESRALCLWDNVQILKLVHGLEDPMREVMYLRLVGNLTFGQIGEIMGRSENWARVTYYRGKERVVKEAGKL